jgi:hypothetical protein
MTQDDARGLYLELLKRMLTRYGFSESLLREAKFANAPIFRRIHARLRKRGLILARGRPYQSLAVPWRGSHNGNPLRCERGLKSDHFQKRGPT